MSTSAISADRPGTVRSIFRGKVKSSSTSDVPPSPESKAQAEDPMTPSMVATLDNSVNPPMRSNADAGRENSNLRRFPRTSTSVPPPLDSPLDKLDQGVDAAVTPIDLPMALQLAGWNSPEVLLAQQRVLAVTAATICRGPGTAQSEYRDEFRFAHGRSAAIEWPDYRGPTQFFICRGRWQCHRVRIGEDSRPAIQHERRFSVFFISGQSSAV